LLLLLKQSPRIFQIKILYNTSSLIMHNGQV